MVSVSDYYPIIPNESLRCVCIPASGGRHLLGGRGFKKGAKRVLPQRKMTHLSKVDSREVYRGEFSLVACCIYNLSSNALALSTSIV